MIGFASRTGTLRNIAALQAAGWGCMIAPGQRFGPQAPPLPYAIDNGAWTAHATGTPWDGAAFLALLARHGRGARFVVVPDVVGERAASLAQTLHWLPILAARADLAGAQLLFAVQDGMEFADVAPHVGGRVGLFIGGSTAWKESAIVLWASWASARGIYCHVGRVNTARRIALCAAGGANSFDGTSATMFCQTLPMLAGAARQADLFAPVAGAAMI